MSWIACDYRIIYRFGNNWNDCADSKYSEYKSSSNKKLKLFKSFLYIEDNYIL
jgi:hypothetical protein